VPVDRVSRTLAGIAKTYGAFPGATVGQLRPLRSRPSHLDLTSHNPRSEEGPTLYNTTRHRRWRGSPSISCLRRAGLGEGWGNASRVLLGVRDRTVAPTPELCLTLWEFGRYSGREKRKEASFLPVVILSERPRRQGYAPPRLKKRRLDRCGPL
jgi:hypothetical protein